MEFMEWNREHIFHKTSIISAGMLLVISVVYMKILQENFLTEVFDQISVSMIFAGIDK